MSEPFVGEIRMFAGNFAPRGWALCDGQLLAVSQNDALFSILGTIYGGDGRTTFGLPDLRGRLSMHAGTGPGLSPHKLGTRGGVEHVTLTVNEIPAHNHKVEANSDPGNTPSPVNAIPAAETAPAVDVWTTNAKNGDMKASTIQNTGGSQQHENRQPYLSVNFIIALQGLYPSRS